MILSLDDIQLTRFLRKNRFNLIYFVCKSLSQNMDQKNISILHLVKIRKNLCTRKSPVSSQHRMCARSTYRKTCSLNMPDTLFQNLGTETMVDSKRQIQLGDLDTSHQPVTIWIKDLIVRMTENIILFVKSIYDRIDLMLRVVFLSLLPELFVLVIRQITDGFIVLGYKLRISVLIPVITDRWVSKDTRTDDKK